MDRKIWGIIGGLALALALLSPLVLGSTKKVERIFDDAKGCYERSEYRDALEKYKKALKESKKYGVNTESIDADFAAHVNYSIGRCLKQLDRDNEALQYYRFVIVEFPDSQYATDSYVDSGDIYFDRKDYEAASEEYKRALEMTEDAARREQINQKYQIVLNFINPLGEEIDTTDFAAFTEATFLRFRERFEEAAIQYNAFASNYLPAETAVYALYWAGRCYHKAGLFLQSVEAFERLIDDYAYTPNTIEAYHGLAVVYFDWAKRDQDTSKCQLTIETLEEAEQEYADSRVDLDRQVLSLMRKIKRQVEKYESDKQRPPEPPKEVLTNQGREHFDRGELALAEEKVKEALRIDSEYLPAKQLLRNIKERYYNQGLEALDQNDNHTAVVKFNRVIDIDSNDRTAYFHLGVAYFNLHNCIYAEEAVNNALAINPDYEEAHRLLEAIIEKRRRNQ